MVRKTDRRVALAAGLSAGGAVAAATALGATHPAEATIKADTLEQAGITGVVTRSSGTGELLEVAPESPATLKAEVQAMIARSVKDQRPLRAGDRVVVERDAASGEAVATPLFRGVEGPIERISRGSLVIGGVRCVVDGSSMAYDATTGLRTPLGRVQHLTGLATGTRVGVLCIDNPAQQRLTIDALYLIG